MAGKGMQIREGNRGGRDQFEWDDVKVDKHRENYLGHSVKASVGRWQKGKDLTWYTKNSKVSGQKERLKEEVAAIKRAEEEAMAAALGLKPPAPVQPQQALTQQEMAEVCRRKSTDEIENGGEERIKGIGYQSRRAQAMFMVSKSTTTKEGATIFEHDALVNDDGRLKMPESKRRSVSDVTSPTTDTPVKQDETLEKRPAVITTATPTTHILDSAPASGKWKKKVKNHKEKMKSHHRQGHFSDSSTSELDSQVKRKETKKRKKHEGELKHKKKRRKVVSSEDEWAEKQLPQHKTKRAHRDSRSPQRRVGTKKSRHRSSSSSSQSENESRRKEVKKHRGHVYESQKSSDHHRKHDERRKSHHRT